MENILYYIIVFISNIVQAITGFAGTLLAMPPAMRLVGIPTAKMTLNFFGLAVSIVVWIQNRRNVRAKEVGKILIYMTGGLGLGFLIERIVPIGKLSIVYAIFLIVFALYKLLYKRERDLNRITGIIIIICAGIIHEWFVSGGALLVVYAASTFKDKDQFRASLAPVWVILNTILLFSHIQLGYATPANLTRCVFGLIPVFAAIIIGNKLHDKVKQSTFTRISYILIACNGVFLLL